MASINWGRMTAEETAEAVRDGLANLTEEVKIEIVRELVEEIGGPENFGWISEQEAMKKFPSIKMKE